MKTARIFQLKTLVCTAFAWALLMPCTPAAEGLPRLSWDDRAGLEANVGNEVLVTGTIRNVGNTNDGKITFLNFGGPRDNAFVAVVFEKHYGAFPNGFSELRGQTVTVRGVLEFFRNEQPQIRVETADQISFGDVETAAAEN